MKRMKSIRLATWILLYLLGITLHISCVLGQEPGVPPQQPEELSVDGDGNGNDYDNDNNNSNNNVSIHPPLVQQRKEEDALEKNTSKESGGGTGGSEKETTRLWGSSRPPSTSTPPDSSSTDPSNRTKGSMNSPLFVKPGGGGSGASAATNTSTGFTIHCRVYTDPMDKMAHFDNTPSLLLPYGDCGVLGSNTLSIPTRHVTFRQLLVGSGSVPTAFGGDEFGPHPQLLVALAPMEILLNSGQVQKFQPGDIILLEDVIDGGHILKAIPSNAGRPEDRTAMLLTLDQNYHHVGKDKTSLDRYIQRALLDNDISTGGPCPIGESSASSSTFSSMEGVVQNSLGLAAVRKNFQQVQQTLQPFSMRRFSLAVVGLSLSTVLGDYMGKVAPLWLAVAFGGGCFVTGGTVLFVKMAETVWEEVEMWKERRPFAHGVSPPSSLLSNSTKATFIPATNHHSNKDTSTASRTSETTEELKAGDTTTGTTHLAEEESAAKDI
eukprot:Nitzschia sp. Nitz4//scaffold228_size32365//30205//31683//NITZ4_007912-RA/size32365-processed-gene-0.35-mRNA-1//1//CDS//3329542837//6316//frame0